MVATKLSKRENVKYQYKCRHCGATWIFYVRESDVNNKERDKKLSCAACRKQGGLVRGEADMMGG